MVQSEEKLENGCVYVAVAENGIIKIGKTKNKGPRRSSLKKAFCSLGTSLVEIRFFSDVWIHWEVERKLIGKLTETLTVSHGREWFIGGDYENVCRLAEELTNQQIDENNKFRARREKNNAEAAILAKERKQKRRAPSFVFENIFHDLTA